MVSLDPIEVRAAAACLDSYVQALLATTLTLMTASVHASTELERASMLHTIASNLQELAQREELEEEFRRLCGRLQQVWADRAEEA